jgi:amidase
MDVDPEVPRNRAFDWSIEGETALKGQDCIGSGQRGGHEMNEQPDEIFRLSALELRDNIRRREVSAPDLARAFLDRIATADRDIGAFVTVDREFTLAAAEAAQSRIDAGEDLPLAGVPYALKDLTDTAGMLTTYGSRMRSNNVPTLDAAVARRMRDAGGILLGKTNTPEFGNRATTAFGLFPPTHNPWNLDKIAGGSSGGSGAAVAACMAPIAEGSDGGGSIRVPASCCGVVGIKPSRGRVSSAPYFNPRGGLITHGPIARTVADAALVLDVMAGYESGDTYYAPPPAQSFLSSALTDPKRLRIGMLTTSDKWIDPEVVAAVEQTGALLQSLGHTVGEAKVDLTGLGPIFRIMCHSESAANDLGDPAEFSDPFSAWCAERGKRWSAVDYIKATEELFGRGREIINQMAEWDCIILPTVAQTPPDLDTFLAETDRASDDDLAYIPFTYPFNISGQPALSLPLGWSKAGLPIGVQFVGQPYGEGLIISLAAEVERGAPWAARYPAHPVDGA